MKLEQSKQSRHPELWQPYKLLSARVNYTSSVLPDWSGYEREVYLMYRDRDKRPARIDAFITHVSKWKAKYSINSTFNGLL